VDEDGNPLIECHKQEIMDEYVWSMDILEGSTLESKEEDHVDEPMGVTPILCFSFIKS
jgi:hypothetical protein